MTFRVNGNGSNSGKSSGDLSRRIPEGQSFEARATSILKMRRERDRLFLLIAYCLVGLFFSFSSVALASDSFSFPGLSSQEVCVNSYKEMETSSSEILRNAMPRIRGKSFTNKSNGTHLKFKDDDRLMLTYYSTTGDNDDQLEFREGALRICEKNKRVSISSAATGNLHIHIADDGCFRIQGMAATLAGPGPTTFCPGTMPAKVATALENSNRKLAGTPNGGSPIQSSAVAR
ncbi:MAG: hypothetical protein RBT63_06835 [Bdellovibrionales bacterium]|nr:hypothetical protein [Bdellovibrionales bacterium]